MNYAYALLKPDVILRDALSSVLKILESCRFEVRSFRIGSLTDEMYQAMYARAFLWNLDHWSHNKQAYSFGPVIGLILCHSDTLQTGSTAQSVLNTLKGSALPRDLVPGTIRAAAFATSRVFNVIHVPEEIEVAKYEARLWFGTNRQSEDASVPNAVDVEVTAHGYSSDTWLDSEATFLFVKARLMHALQWQDTDKNVNRQLAVLREMYTGWANRMLSVRERAARKSLCSEWRARERLELNNLLAANPHGNSLSRLTALLRDLDADNVAASNCLAFFWDQILMARVHVSSLERYLITTKVLYPLQ